MVEHGQTVFLLERMNRSWFNRNRRSILTQLLAGLLIGLSSRPCWPGWLVGYILVCFGLFIGLGGGLGDIRILERVRFQASWLRLAVGLVMGCWAARSGKFFGLVGLVAALLGYLSGVLFSGRIDAELSTELEQSYRVFRPNAGTHRTLIVGLAMGLVMGLPAGLLVGLLAGQVGLVWG